MTTSSPPRRRRPWSRPASPSQMGFLLFLVLLALSVVIVTAALALPGNWILLPVILGFAALYPIALAFRRWAHHHPY